MLRWRASDVYRLPLVASRSEDRVGRRRRYLLPLLITLSLLCFAIELRILYLHSANTAHESDSRPPIAHVCVDEPQAETPPLPSSSHRYRPAERERLRRLLDEPAGMPSANELRALAAYTVHAPSSVSVVLEYNTPGSLCRQLRALLKCSLTPRRILVDAAHAIDGGAAAEAIVASLAVGGGRISVLSALVSGGNEAGREVWRASPRRRRFALALQEESQYVLVLDASVEPGPHLLEQLVAAAEIPACRGVIGVAGWRTLRASSLAAADRPATAARSPSTEAEVGGFASEPPDDEAACDEVGDVSLSFPNDAAALRVRRLTPADALRGAWFLRTEWLPLVLRDPASYTADGRDDEAAISALFRRFGNLSSFVLPQPELEVGNNLQHEPALVLRTLPEPTDAMLRAWRAQLWRAARRGDPPPLWRSPEQQPEGVQRPSTTLNRLFPQLGKPESLAHKTPVLLILPTLDMAKELGSLYEALLSSSSLYEPRLVYAPSVDCGSVDECGCSSVAAALGLELASPSRRRLCRSPSALVILGGNRFWEGSSARDANMRALGGSLASLLVELDNVMHASRAALVIAPAAAAAEDDLPIVLAARSAAESHGVPVLRPPPNELVLLEWVAIVPPDVLARWHEPKVTLAIITHRRPASLRRLLKSLSSAYYLGDSVELTLSLDAGADEETLALARGWEWPHGVHSVHSRVVRAGLIGAVVESWTPAGNHSYGVLLEDDIEVSPYFYVYCKLALLSYVLPLSHSDRMLAISLYTPRLVELTMPRHKINLYNEVGLSPGGVREPLFAQQLPCSWGSLFLPQAWLLFREYMQQRLADAPPLTIPGSASNGWKESWKKFMIELMYLRGQVVLYPNLRNQTSFSTNHLERGEHIGGKKNSLRHDPADFTVPLVVERQLLRQLYTDAAGRLQHPTALERLPVLDLFSKRTSVDTLHFQAKAAMRSHLQRASGLAGRLDAFAQALGL